MDNYERYNMRLSIEFMEVEVLDVLDCCYPALNNSASV